MTNAAPTEEKKLTNPHDRFFKQTLSRPEVATDLIRYYLPPEIVTLLDLTTVQIAKDSFVDKELQTHFSDLLYQVRTHDGNPAYVYTLFDHKSYSDSDVAFQLLRYKARIWEQLPRLDKNKLPPIVPVVFYHGVTRWMVDPAFAALFPEEMPASLLPFLPNFQYHIIDLSGYNDAEIRGAVLLRVTLLLFKYVLREDLREHLADILNLLNQLSDRRTGLEYLETALRYLYHGAKAVTLVDLRQAVTHVFNEGGEIMATIAEVLVEQGRADGLREGILESIGIVLELKFGAQGLQLLAEIQQIADVDLLRQVQRSLRTVATVAQVRAIYQPT
ncbi:MAG: Rpn family recombination-promoting nuclease/putative transposase [Caldilinea sp. CFX5]|nr:Rpn family recombination-promoting nuclease/putative transposase [Caldilinea sp. CFX5]